MRRERTNVKHPLWRKGVDESLLFHSIIPIPQWLYKKWGLPSKKEISVKVIFKNSRYEGTIKIAKVTDGKRNIPRLIFQSQDKLLVQLRHTFMSSYVRLLERKFSNASTKNIENKIPFAEFLDIEYNKQNKTVILQPYYCQKPNFPKVFEFLVGAPALNKHYDELNNKSEKEGIYFSDKWTPREELDYETVAKDAVYILVDTKRKLLYVGLSTRRELKKRLSDPHPTISKWNHYTFCLFPPEASKHLLTMEKFLIRSIASLLKNKGDKKTQDISSYVLTNKQFDKKNQL